MDEEEFSRSDSESSQTHQNDVKRTISFLGRRIAAVASSVGGAIARSAEAAAEVLTDADLRRRGAQVLADNASKAAKGIQHGLHTGATSIQRGLQTVQSGPKQIQAILVRVQQQIEEQRIVALLEEQRDAPVDVQVGCQLYEDAPQELRSRLWMALLEHPELVAEYQSMLAAAQRAQSSPAGASSALSPVPEAPSRSSLGSPAPSGRGTPEHPPPSPTGAGPQDGKTPGGAHAAGAQEEEGEGGGDPSRIGGLLEASAAEEGAGCAEGQPAASASAGPPLLHDGSCVAEEGAAQDGAGALRGAAGGGRVGCEMEAAVRSDEEEGAVAARAMLREAAGRVQVPSSGEVEGRGGKELDPGHVHLDSGRLSPASFSPRGSRRGSSPLGAPSASGGGSGQGDHGQGQRQPPPLGGATLGFPSSWHSAPSPSPSPPSSSSSGTGVGSEGWEVVDQGRQRQGQAVLMGAAIEPAATKDQEAFRNLLMGAMAAVPWPLPTTYPEECRYATLLQISVGQEEIDEVISRDIHRTFPEHPLFGFEQGQQALFRVLKAYSLHDIEVGYCQGMAFVAGLLLFYMNEEPAFQMFCRLLGACGPNLRRLYLPGLEGLKAVLRQFEVLLEGYLPNLKAHLEACGVVPVLFASQWFLTAFSCPFPVHFACRLLDVMAAEGDDSVMLRAAMAVMAECEADLLMLEDFEDIITYLKVEPVQWPLHRVRRVLHAAVHSVITQQDLREAQAVVEGGYAGSISRHTTTTEADLPPPPSPCALPPVVQPATATAAERALSLRRRVGHSAHSRQGSAVGGAAEPSGQDVNGGPGVGGAGVSVAGDEVEAELARHQADLDEEYMAMVLALDMMWAGEGEEGGGGAAASASPPAATIAGKSIPGG